MITSVSHPNDWEEVTLGELFDFSNGLNAEKAAYGRGTPFANVLEVISNETLTDEKIPGRISLPPEILSRYRVSYGDVLFNRTSETQDEVGLSSVYLGDAPIVFGGFVFRGRPITDKLTVNYSKYCLRSADVRRQIAACGQGAIRANISQRDLKTVRVALPGANEQEAIASVLSDAADAIATLERLVEKKQAVKQGMTQQMLTGRTRLFGFGEPWVTLHVASRSMLKARIGWQGLTTAEYQSFGTYRLVGGTEFKDGRINWNATPFVDKWRYDQDRDIQLRVGDVLLTKDGTIGKTAFVDRLPGAATLNSGVYVIRPRDRAYDSRFLYFMLRSRAFDEFLAKLTAGSTISHLYQRDLVGLTLLAPSDIQEQHAIATALSDADAEIDALKKRLEKAKAIKQGLAQQLLTGKRRLPVLEAVA